MLFAIGSVLCFNHIKNENKIDRVLNSSEAGVTDLSETLDVSPIKFQIKKRKWQN